MEKSRYQKSDELNFLNEVHSHLAKSGEVGGEISRIIRSNNIRLKFRKQKHSAASWTLTGNILINIEIFPKLVQADNPYLLGLIVHETHHLQQGFLTALSVFGELDAWQVGFRFYKEISNSKLNPYIEEILKLPLDFSRKNLKRAACLMKKYSPGYRIDLLPLYPLHHEIVWWLTSKMPG